MFGKRSTSGPDLRSPAPPHAGGAAAGACARAVAAGGGSDVGRAPLPSDGLGAPITSPPRAPGRGPKPIVPTARDTRRSESYYEVKGAIFAALIEAIDLSQLARLDAEAAREEIRDIVNEIIAIKNIVMSIAEQEELLDDICNDVLGYGPLEPLLARDDIADIMVNGANTVYIEVDGKIQQTNIRFRDNQQLLNICQRIVSQIGRRVDEASPICDARLPDGSRVNVIVPPLAIDGPALTIRKFKKDKLTLDQLVKFGSISPEGAEILQDHRPLPRQRADLRRHRLGQDHAAQLPDQLHRRRRAHHHLRGRRRTAAAAAARGAPRDPPAQPRGRGPDHDARSGQELPAHAARAHHRRRGARTRGVRPAAGDEHRPRRLDGHAARQHAARGALAASNR